MTEKFPPAARGDLNKIWRVYVSVRVSDRAKGIHMKVLLVRCVDKSWTERQGANTHSNTCKQNVQVGPQPGRAVLSASTKLSHDNSNNESILLAKNAPSPPLTHFGITESLNKESCGIVTIKTPHPRHSSSEDRQILKIKRTLASLTRALQK